MSQPGGEGEDRHIYELAALGRDGMHAEIERLKAGLGHPQRMRVRMPMAFCPAGTISDVGTGKEGISAGENPGTFSPIGYP
jgi:hypothetical protein